ncbi:hypothetical protein QBC44DRAFT_387943 [Cladorrhinum sp. PSN332]|nr:hypothetical protein QBC44DRAFT_387943 [Cladorrhinum sp. PSN332]
MNSVHHLPPGDSTLLASSGSLSSSTEAELDLSKIAADNDPQTLFYLTLGTNNTSGSQPVEGTSVQDILTTAYFWAVKIERTILNNKLGKGTDVERHDIQACWARAAYRVKILNTLAGETTWLTFVSTETVTATRHQLSGDYHHDKLVYQEAIRNGVTTKFPEIDAGSLDIIGKLIAEILALGRHSLSSPKTISFSFALPLLINSGGITQSALRLVTVNFTTKDVDGKPGLEAYSTVNQGTLNKPAFDEAAQQFGQTDLEIGKALVQGLTLTLVGTDLGR